MTTRYRDSTAIQDAVRLGNVPPAKWKRMVARTFAGLTVMGIAWASGAVWAAPWYVPTTLAALAAHVWSGQVLNASAKRAIPLIRELVSAVKGGK